MNSLFERQFEEQFPRGKESFCISSVGCFNPIDGGVALSLPAPLSLHACTCSLRFP